MGAASQMSYRVGPLGLVKERPNIGTLSQYWDKEIAQAGETTTDSVGFSHGPYPHRLAPFLGAPVDPLSGAPGPAPPRPLAPEPKK